MMFFLVFILIQSTCLIAVVSGTSYRPGITPRTYELGETLPLKVDALTSTRTQIPMDYYSLPFCQPEGGPKLASQNMGENLEGSRIQSSPFRVRMAVDLFCEKVCPVTLDLRQYEKMKWHIDRRYHYNFLLDHLPSAVIGDWEYYSNGFPIGVRDDSIIGDNYFIYNHFNIVIDFHRVKQKEETGYRVVEFAVQPLSVYHRFTNSTSSEGGEQLSTCEKKKHLSPQDVRTAQPLVEGEPIIFTYDVIWRDSAKPFSDRWQVYLSNDNRVPMAIHWYSITNSAVLLFLLSAMLVLIWIRSNQSLTELANNNSRLATSPASLTVGEAVHSAFSFLRNRRYASLSRTDTDGESQAAAAEEVERQRIERQQREARRERKWRVLHGDVFRPPQTLPGLFCAFVGTGLQLIVASLLVVILAALGIVSQAVPGTLPNAFMVCFNLSGVVAGYTCHRLYSSFGGTPSQIKRCVGMTAVIFPGCVFASFCFLNICLWSKNSTASLPVLDIFIILLGWLCGLVPLVIIGTYIASLQEVLEYPTHTNPVPRIIPEQPMWKRPFVLLPITGILPFGALYVEMYFALSSLWFRQYYYVFEAALIVYCVALLTSANIACIMVYIQLCFENHRWWWCAFYAGGSVGFIFGIYSFIFASKLELDRSFVTHAVYFIYMFWISAAMCLVFGAVGSVSAMFFLFIMYRRLDPEEMGVEEEGGDDSGYIMLDNMAQSSDSDNNMSGQTDTEIANDNHPQDTATVPATNIS